MINPEVEQVKELFDTKKYEKLGVTEQEVLKIKQAFDAFDTDKSGDINAEELRTAVNHYGIDVKFQTLVKIMNELEADKPGKIFFEEFIEKISAKMTEDENTREDLKKVFELYLG